MSNIARQELALGNQIVANEGIIDAFVHVSMRHPENPHRYLLSCSRAPELVTPDDFTADFKDLYPVIKAFNDNADDFISDLELLPTFPFHYKYLRNAVRGDYLNVFVTFDLTIRRTGETIFTTSKGLYPNMKHLDVAGIPMNYGPRSPAVLTGLGLAWQRFVVFRQARPRFTR